MGIEIVNVKLWDLEGSLEVLKNQWKIQQLRYNTLTSIMNHHVMANCHPDNRVLGQLISSIGGRLKIVKAGKLTLILELDFNVKLLHCQHSTHYVKSIISNLTVFMCS
jgi:hypothetical protein